MCTDGKMLLLEGQIMQIYLWKVPLSNWIIFVYLTKPLKLFPKSYLWWSHVNATQKMRPDIYKGNFKSEPKVTDSSVKDIPWDAVCWPGSSDAALLLGAPAWFLCTVIFLWSKKWRLHIICYCLHLSEQCDIERTLQAVFYN